jgi:glycosyltransferase involved in cell wall biosynthesis
MRIAYFCQYFVPESAAPAARVSELAKAWVHQGHHVTVITGLPNHPTGIVPTEYRGVAFRREQLDGVEVFRNWLYATPNEGFVKKTLSHLSFMLSTLIFSVPRLRRYDIFIVSSPSFFVVVTVCLAHWLWRTPYIFEVRDLWPGIFIELGVLKNRVLIRTLESVEMFLYRRAAHVVVVTESFREILLDRGVCENRVSTIANGVDLEAFRPDPAAGAAIRREHGLEHCFVVLYIGAHGISHALNRIVDVAANFQDDADVRFVFVGDGAEKQKLVQRVKAQAMPNVQLLPSQQRSRVSGWYNAADIALVPLRNIPLFDTFIPSKMFEIMGAGRAIIASVRGEARRILARSGAAVIVDPEDVEAMTAAIRLLRTDDARRAQLASAGRAFVSKEYDRITQARRYLELLESCAGAPTRAS